MSNKANIMIPRTVIWLLRIAAHPILSWTLPTDPTAFSVWYARVADFIDWPEPVARIRKAERDKQLSLDQAVKLLSQLSSGRPSSGNPRLLLEGYAVHEWVLGNFHEFRLLVALTRDSATLAKRFSETALEQFAPLAARVLELGRILKLSPLEQDVLSFAFFTTVSDKFNQIFERFTPDRSMARELWSAVCNTSTEKLAEAMRPGSPLRLSGLLQTGDRGTELARVPPFWVELLEGANSLTDALLEPFDGKAGSGRPAALPEEDLALAIRLLRHENVPGVNLLLYGAESLEKRQLLHEIVTGSGRTPWRTRRFDNAPREVLPSLTFVAIHLLAAKTPSGVLVIERPSEVLHTAPSKFWALLGNEMAEVDSLAFDENLLATNPAPAVWLISDVASLPDDTIARFVFHAPLKKAARQAQESVIRERLKELQVSEAAAAQILTVRGISSAQLEPAVKASQLVKAGSECERDQAIVQAIRHSQRARSRNPTEAFKPSMTHYSLEYLNTAGRFSPQQILQSFRRRPKGSMLLHGLPGTGKTQFVEHLASELGLPLVSKSASALLSKWVGDSEKNIAAAFAEAAAEDAILFFDEGDSFLRSRERAQHSWEVTQTNELLQKMERFEGIVVVATNLFRDLDAAAMRRFTFKIEFRELDSSQRWKMFVTEAGLTDREATLDAATRERWEQRLLFMRYLAPGDFATIKRQCLVLDTQLSPEEWLEQLEIECQIKTAAPRLESAVGRAA